MQSFPLTNIIHQMLSFLSFFFFKIKDKPTLTHLKFIVYFRVHPWCCTFYVYVQKFNEIYPPSSQGYGFSSGHVWMWELDYKESWVPKNWCLWTVMLEKTFESPRDSARRSNQSILKEISSGCSLERLMLRLKPQYFGHLMLRADSLKDPGVRISFQDRLFIFSKYMPKRGIPGPYGSCIFRRKLHTFFYKARISLHTYQQCMKFPYSPHPL